MATSMYELALQLEQKLNKVSAKKGHAIFRTLKGETKFVFQFEKKYKQGIFIHLFKTEEELPFSILYEKKVVMGNLDTQLLFDSSWIYRGIKIFFVEKSKVSENEIRRIERAGVDVQSLESLPILWNCTDESVVKNTYVANQSRKFVEQVLPIILQEGTLEKLEVIWNKNQKYFHQKVPVFTYNQRTKEANFVTHESMISLDESEKYRYFASDSPAPLLISELEYDAFMQQIETTVNMAMQLRIGVQMMAELDFAVNNPLFMMQIADSDSMFEMVLLDSLAPKLIQKEFLKIFEKTHFIPKLILTSGIFGTYLRNVLDPLAKRLSIKMKQVDSLPTFNRMEIDDYLPFYIELYGFDVPKVDREFNNRFLED